MPAEGLDPRVAYRLIHDELMLDGNARQNLATFVTTFMDEEADRLFAETLDKNMIDKDEYPQTAEIEGRCVQHHLRACGTRPSHEKATGTSTTGSSEAVMLGGLALKWRWRQRREAAGLPVGQAEPGHGHQRAGRLGEVLPLLGRRAALRPDRGGPPAAQRRGGAQARRREHHRRRGHPGLDLRRLLRAGQGDRRRPRRAGGLGRAGRAGARRRGLRRVRRTVHRPRAGVGLPGAAGPLDQRLRAQVRAGLPGRRLGHLAQRPRTCPRTSSST